jgi:hypothetical protein
MLVNYILLEIIRTINAKYIGIYYLRFVSLRHINSKVLEVWIVG